VCGTSSRGPARRKHASTRSALSPRRRDG
jgi:hypothetical protein